MRGGGWYARTLDLRAQCVFDAQRTGGPADHMQPCCLGGAQERRLRAAVVAAPGGVQAFEAAIRALSVRAEPNSPGMSPTHTGPRRLHAVTAAAVAAVKLQRR